jgi:hypothetical protein
MRVKVEMVFEIEADNLVEIGETLSSIENTVRGVGEITARETWIETTIRKKARFVPVEVFP